MKPKRFFYHYHKPKKMMTVHFDNKCIIVNNIVCNVPCETKWNKRQPFIVMRGFANEVKVTETNTAIIS